MSNLSIDIVENSGEIIKYLQIGTAIPIWPEFHQYILNDLNYFSAKAILLRESRDLCGNVLIFDDRVKTLYFGYFGIINNVKEKMDFLIEELVKFAKVKGYNTIKGPVNIPAIIYGYGFMKEGSRQNLFIAKPVNPPIYQEAFIEKGFIVSNEIVTWAAYPLLRYNPWETKKYDYTNYEYLYPKDINDFNKNYKNEFLRLHAENLPPSAIITPNVKGVIDNYANFTFNYGYNFMIFFIRYKPTQEFIACGAYVPNPFRKNKKGIHDSVYVYSWVVDPKYRRKGIAFLMYGATSLLLYKNKIRHGSGMISSNNRANTEFAMKELGAKKTRVHLILEYNLI